MSKKQQSAQAQESIRSDVFVIENYTDKDGKDQARWIRVGVAFPHNDNKGFNLKCTALPVNGELVIRLHEPRPENAE